MNPVVEYLKKYNGSHVAASENPDCPYGYQALRRMAGYFQDGVFDEDQFLIDEAGGNGDCQEKAKAIFYARAEVRVQRRTVTKDLDRFGITTENENLTSVWIGGEKLLGDFDSQLDFDEITSLSDYYNRLRVYNMLPNLPNSRVVKILGLSN